MPVTEGFQAPGITVCVCVCGMCLHAFPACQCTCVYICECVYSYLFFSFTPSEKLGCLSLIQTCSLCQDQQSHFHGSQPHPQIQGEPQLSERSGNVGRAEGSKAGLSWYG